MLDEIQGQEKRLTICGCQTHFYVGLNILMGFMLCSIMYELFSYIFFNEFNTMIAQ